MTTPQAASPRKPLRRRVAFGVLLALAAAAVAFAWAEAAGWPFLASPAERYLSRKLQRQVTLQSAAGGGFALHLLGTPRLSVDRLVVGNASWSRLGPLLTADQAAVAVRWGDLLAARRGAPLVVKELSARAADVQVQRLADGRASWQVGPRDVAADAAPAMPGIHGVRIEGLRVASGTFRIDDALMATDIAGRFASSPQALPGRAGWVADGAGRWRALPARGELRIGATDPGVLAGGLVPLAFDLNAGATRLRFEGSVTDPLHRRTLNGRYKVHGPSLAAAGEVLRITLPTTPAFSMSGTLRREGPRWHTVVSRAAIGRSRLAGEFEFERPPQALPVLRGELRGSALWLQDLGPAVGTRPRPERRLGRVLPDRRFDFPSLRRMQADVRFALDRLELGHPKLQDMRQVKARLKLDDGVLVIDDFAAQLAQGRFTGQVRLDGRGEPARWNVDVTARGLRLEQWIAQPRARGGPPYVTGRLTGRVQLAGQGRSTAELLASSSGRTWLVWSQGTVSHLVVEGAGIDIAQAIGVLVRGDDPLPVTCGAADLHVERGRVVPKVLVVDTTDSTLWAEGAVSLADERLDLVVRVDPKDFSPLAPRVPVLATGTLAKPQLALDKAALARRLAPSALLAFAHPLAALLPLVDAGAGEGASEAADCRQVAARLAGRGGT